MIRLFFFILISKFSFGNDLSISSSYEIYNNGFQSIENVNFKKSKLFNQNDIIQVGMNKNATVWCKIKIKNNTNSPLTKWISFKNIHLDSVLFFENQKIKKILGDRTDKFSDHSTSYSYRIFLKPNESKEVVVKLKKIISFFEFDFEVSHQKKLENKHTINLIFSTLFIGLIIALSFLIFILFLITYQKMYLYYIFYTFLTLIYLAITTGFAKFYVFPRFIYFSELRVYSGSFWIMFLFYFYKELLQLRSNFPNINKLIVYGNLANCINILSTAFIDKQAFFPLVSLFWKIGYLIFLLQGIGIGYATFKSKQINRKISFYISLSFIPHFLWFITYILRSFKIVIYEQNFEWLMTISIYEAFLFGIILGYNYLVTFTSNNQLVHQLNSIETNTQTIISKIQINERRNLSNLIHDKLGNQLALLHQLIENENKDLVKIKLKELSHDIRHLSHSILPKSLENGAFKDAISKQVEIVNLYQKQCIVHIQSFDFPEQIKKDWVFDVYLITLEIISNTLKHAYASQLLIELYLYSDKYVFQFSDNGIGLRNENFSNSFGISSIQDRVRKHKGEIEISSTPNYGTSIQIIFPI